MLANNTIITTTTKKDKDRKEIKISKKNKIN